MKPFVVTALQAVKMPRWLLLLMCLLYAVPGLLGRDPWRFADAAGFGISWTMANAPAGGAQWLVPNVVGAPVTDTGPLPFWLGALAMKALPFLPADTAMRLMALLWLALLLSSVWYATWHLGSRPEVQPTDPFGASASRVDFGRALADCAVLVLLATFGLVARVHETTTEAAQVAWTGLFLLGCAMALERPTPGGLLAGLAVGMTVMSRGIPSAVALGLVAVLLPLATRPYRLVMRPMLSNFVPAALLASIAWPLALGIGSETATAHRQLWLAWNASQVNVPSPAEFVGFLRNLPWFFWPAWPIALWALWQWRTRRLEPAIALPALTAAGLLLVAFVGPGPSDAALLPMVPAVAMLAAMGLPRLRRSISSLIDWFAVVTFSLIGLALWAYWIAFMTGWPPRMALSAERASRGFNPVLDPLELVLGLAATLAWVMLVYWRISRQPRALWRTVALSGGGMVLTWFLLMTLWLPAGNYRNTYRDVAQQAGAAMTEPQACVATLGLDAAQRATFAYFGGLRFDDARSDCPWLLVAERVEPGAAATALPGGDSDWTAVWRGQRPADRRERFRLMRRSRSGP